MLPSREESSRARSVGRSKRLRRSSFCHMLRMSQVRVVKSICQSPFLFIALGSGDILFCVFGKEAKRIKNEDELICFSSRASRKKNQFKTSSSGTSMQTNERTSERRSKPTIFLFLIQDCSILALQKPLSLSLSLVLARC